MRFTRTGFLVLALCAVDPAEATEAAAGRYLPGLYAGPGAGVVAPAPGLYWASTSFHYFGEAGRDIRIPIGGDLQVSAETETVSTAYTILAAPKLDLPKGWTYAAALTVPVQNNETSAGAGSLERTDDLLSIGDIVVTPIVLGWSDGTHFVSASLPITAPTGDYDRGQIAVVGLNYWTVSPTIGYSYIDTKRGLDFSIKAGLDINTENHLTDYHSGAMAHLDVTLTKTFGKFGLGVFGSVLYQVEDDEGRLADRLDGFRGRSFAIGPMVRYALKTDLTEVDFSLSWAPEFGVENRFEGNVVYFGLNGKF